MPELRLTIPAELDGQTVRQAAMKGLDMSNGLFKRAKFHGQVLLDGVPVLANAAVRQGQNLLLSFPEKENTAPAPVELGLRVAFEDEYLMMVDKPAPLPSASSPRQALPTLENAVYAYLGCPEDFVYRPVNRLDKGTSGLMLVAKTAYAQDQMQRLLHTDHFQREYLAVAEGRLPEKQGLIDLPIRKADGATVKREVGPGGKEARTMNFWTKDEYLRFSDAMMDDPRAFVIFEVLYWTGIREGELLALTPDSFDWKKSTMRIDKSYQRLGGRDVITDPKTPKSVRTVKLSRFLADEGREYSNHHPEIGEGDRLFPVSKHYISHAMQRGCAASGVKKIRVHDLRHSHVSLLINMGFTALAIADRMGHEATDITFRYAHLFPNVQDDMANELEEERGGF